MAKTQAFPATLNFAHQKTSSRLWVIFTVLIPIKPIILIPHFIALMVLGMVAGVLMIVGLLTTLITGSYPPSLENFLVGVSRWKWRVGAYFMCLTDKYPPFSLE